MITDEINHSVTSVSTRISGLIQDSLNRIREKAIRNSRFSIRSFIRSWFIDLLEASSGFNQEQRIVRMRRIAREAEN